jgi:hypothetical protein
MPRRRRFCRQAKGQGESVLGSRNCPRQGSEVDTTVNPPGTYSACASAVAEWSDFGRRNTK